MAKLTMRNVHIEGCGTAVKATGDVEIDSEGGGIHNCGTAFDISDIAESQSKPNDKKHITLHQTPAGILALNVASMLSGTAIGRVIGLL